MSKRCVANCYLEPINISRNLDQWHAPNIDNRAGTHGQQNNEDVPPQMPELHGIVFLPRLRRCQRTIRMQTVVAKEG